jgi:hypothetical protein
MILHYLVTAAFIMHGLAHISGFIAAWTSNANGFNKNPWILSKSITLHTPVGKLFGLLWLAAMIALVFSGLGLLFWPSVWPVLPVVGAILSLGVIIPWWNTVVPGAKVGAVFDLLTLVALIFPWNQQVMAALGL